MEIPIPEEFKVARDYDLEPFHRLIQRLRHPELGCPWDKSRTLPSMAKPLVEEAKEAAEALAGADYLHQCEELGDVLLNVMLAVVIAEEEERFRWRDVVEAVTAKLVRRHPHVFGDSQAVDAEDAMRQFLAAKAKERQLKQ